MDIFFLFQTLLYIAFSALLYPVIILLIFLFIMAVIQAGDVLSEFIYRKKLPSTLPIPQKPEDFIPEDLSLPVKRYLQKLREEIGKKEKNLDIRVENLLREKELKVIGELEKLKIMVRIGPSLGLMGTLIMGTALSALFQGDMERMSSSLILAFTTTVVGIAVAAIVYFLMALKDGWVKRDIKNMEVITEIVIRDHEIS